jgi:hypothetical protein
LPDGRKNAVRLRRTGGEGWICFFRGGLDRPFSGGNGWTNAEEKALDVCCHQDEIIGGIWSFPDVGIGANETIRPLWRRVDLKNLTK